MTSEVMSGISEEIPGGFLSLAIKNDKIIDDGPINLLYEKYKGQLEVTYSRLTETYLGNLILIYP